MAATEATHIFDNLSSKFNCILYNRNEKQQKYIQSLLDELNNLNYKQAIVTNNNKAILLIHQLCTVVSPTDTQIIERCCILIVNLVSHQRVNIAGRTLSFTLEWVIQILRQQRGDVVSTNVLQCLECLIRDNVDCLLDVLPELIEQLLKLIQSEEQAIKLWSVKCFEAIVYKNEANKSCSISQGILNTCSNVFVGVLLEQKPKKCDEILYCKMVNSSLRGLQNILLQSNEFEFDLGFLLGISRCYMAYYLFDSEWIRPLKVMPSNLSVADVKTTVPKEKKGGKMTKQRKPRKSNTSINKKDENKRVDTVNNFVGEHSYTPATIIPENTNITISDSDYSDSETGKSNRIGVTQGRVRQAALNLLLTIVKVSDKHTMFGYWSSFFPDGSPSGIYNLNHCLLQEPSPRGRIAILNVVSTILNGSKIYLSQAETSEKTFAFTPFSMILGSMIQELHKCLCAALKDTSIPVLTQILKCLSLLVQATPYHRISGGLVTLVFKNVQPFIRHRDATVQVAALIVLGCLIASEPIVKETLDNLIENNPQDNQLKQSNIHEQDHDIEYAEFSSDDEDTELNTSSSYTACNNIPWLLEKCLRNLKAIQTKRNDNVPAPVKLESLQVISVMCRNYFKELLAPHLLLVSKGLEICLADKYMDLKLHTGRTVDSIGHSMQQCISTSDQIEKGLQFWQILLNGPLTTLLQNEQHATLRCIGCDCLGSIGPDIFENLPKDKQLLIITLLFTNSRDEENNVRAASVRALAISVLYPSLREDLGFVMDTAEAIIRTLDDSNLTVRIKSSWSLGNLSDALVLYRNNATNEEIPDHLIYELIQASIKISDDNNKIKCNATRALGNLLRLITIQMLQDDKFKADPLSYNYKVITEKAIDVLVRNCNNCPDMKVRWNSCYAIGNFMKNCQLFNGCNTWQHNVYSVLMDLVANFRNFKVRINAALALSVPDKRSHYGIYYFPIWKSLLNALDNSQNNEDFHEFKHRDNLVDQICLSICHLIIFLTKDDLNTLHEILMYHSDALKLQIFRVQDRLVPEKAEILIRATQHINQIQHSTETQQNVIYILKNVFNPE